MVASVRRSRQLDNGPGIIDVGTAIPAGRRRRHGTVCRVERECIGGGGNCRICGVGGTDFLIQETNQHLCVCEPSGIYALVVEKQVNTNVPTGLVEKAG